MALSVNRVFILLGCFLVIAGWATALGGVGKIMQICNKDINDYLDEKGTHKACVTAVGYEWWGIWLSCFVSLLVLIFELAGKAGTWTSTLQALIAACLSVTMIDTRSAYSTYRDGPYDGAELKAVRATLAGFILVSTSLFILIFVLGLENAGYVRGLGSSRTVPAPPKYSETA